MTARRAIRTAFFRRRTDEKTVQSYTNVCRGQGSTEWDATLPVTKRGCERALQRTRFLGSYASRKLSGICLNELSCLNISEGIESTEYREVVFSRCLFNRSNLRGSVFYRCSFVGCKFEECQLDYTAFRGCHFKEVSIRGGSLRGASFSGCDLRGATFFDLDASEMHMELAFWWDVGYFFRKQNRVIFKDGLEKAGLQNLPDVTYSRMKQISKGERLVEDAYILGNIWRILTDSGQSVARVFCVAWYVCLVYATYYYPWSCPRVIINTPLEKAWNIVGNDLWAGCDVSFFDSLYYSMIVFTSLGLSGRAPGVSDIGAQVATASEAFLGVAVLQILSAVVISKVLTQ